MASLSVVPFKRRSALELKAAAQHDRDLEIARKRVIDRAAKVLDRLEARAASYDAQIKALQRRKALACAKTERLENGIVKWMSNAKLQKLVGREHTLSIRPNAPRLIVEDESKIPAEYMREKLISEPDKVQIKAALARDVEIEGVHLAQTVSLIRR